MILPVCASGGAPRRFGTQVAILIWQEREIESWVDIMKLDVPMLAGLISLGTQLLARTQIQGFEGALLSSGVEYGLRGLRAASKQLRRTMTNRTR